MKLIFNDATELTIQSAEIRMDGSLLIKTISATEDELRTIFSDNFRTQKMTVKERESTVAEYENYTDFNAINKYIAGILGVTLYKVGSTPKERLTALEEENARLSTENAELSATVDSILTEILPALMNTEETTETEE